MQSNGRCRTGTAIAAHPSYADREGFGRRARFASGESFVRSIDEQLELLREGVRSRIARVVAVKPHGALYHDASGDRAIAAVVVERSANIFGEVSIVGPGGGALEDAAARAGLAFQREGFADRRYGLDGLIVPRSQSDALLTDPSEAAEQALALARRGGFETLCVHGDTPGAVVIARAVRRALEGQGLLATC